MKNLLTQTTRSSKWLLIAIVALLTGGFAQAQLQQVKATPYDRQMLPVRYLLEQPATGQGGVSMDELNGYMRNLRAIPYQYSQNWKTPQQVQTDFKADCKAKAVALYSILRKRGVDNVRLVIGMRTKKSPLTHAWLVMTLNGKQLLLDPTFFNSVHSFDSIGRNDYVQSFAYEGAKKFRI